MFSQIWLKRACKLFLTIGPLQYLIKLMTGFALYQTLIVWLFSVSSIFPIRVINSTILSLSLGYQVLSLLILFIIRLRFDILPLGTKYHTFLSRSWRFIFLLRYIWVLSLLVSSVLTLSWTSLTLFACWEVGLVLILLVLPLLPNDAFVNSIGRFNGKQLIFITMCFVPVETTAAGVPNIFTFRTYLKYTFLFWILFGMLLYIGVECFDLSLPTFQASVGTDMPKPGVMAASSSVGWKDETNELTRSIIVHDNNSRSVWDVITVTCLIINTMIHVVSFFWK